MQGREGRKSRRGSALLAAALFAAGSRVTPTDDLSNVRLNDSRARFAVGLALERAGRRLELAECQALLDEFSDSSGRPLRASLEQSGLDASAYLNRGVFFYDAPERACGTSNLALTTPRSRAILICGPRVIREIKRDSRHVETILIHELLHSLGLGENPPTSDYITDRVRALCQGRGRTMAAIRVATPDGASELLEAGAEAVQVRSTNAMTITALVEAGRLAAARLKEPNCAGIFSEFSDGSGRTLQQRLDDLGRTGSAHLQAIYFYDGVNRTACQSGRTLAVSEPGSVVVHVCPQFVLRQRQHPEEAPIALIHELLHTLGLGENPPSSEEITRHVRARCGR